MELSDFRQGLFFASLINKLWAAVASAGVVMVFALAQNNNLLLAENVLLIFIAGGIGTAIGGMRVCMN